MAGPVTIVNVQVIGSSLNYAVDQTTVTAITYTLKALPPSTGAALTDGVLTLAFTNTAQAPAPQFPTGGQYQLVLNTP